MKLNRLEVQGFRSFNTSQTVDFAAMQPGLYHVSGKNDVEPELEANGAGKSSLFESVYWALYGKTSRGLKAGSIKNWHSDEKCAVVLDMVTDTGNLSLLRMWGPNALEVDDAKGTRPVDQTELELLLGIQPDAFLFAIYFAQFAPAFVDLSPSEQTGVFSSVLNLDLWENASAEASQRYNEHEGLIRQVREELARLKGQAHELLAQDYTDKEKAWSREHRKELARLDESRESWTGAIKKVEVEVKEAKVDSIEFRLRREVVQKKAEACTIAAHTLKQIEKSLAVLRSKNLTKCPTCGAPVSNEHIKKETASTLQQLEAAKQVADGLLTQHDQALKYMCLVRESEVELNDAEKRLATLVSSMQSTEERIKENKTAKNPFTKLREEQEVRGEALAKNLDYAEAKLSKAERQAKVIQYWVKGFKEIRLALIRESLAQLTIEVNETLFQLGLQDWSVEFDIERETKSGSINRSFTIMVCSPHTDEVVPWGVWSGGESQRLRLAISMGFSNLICNRMGTQPNIECWDEPNQFLSDCGITDLLDVLTERAKKQNKVILLADHRSLSYGGFAGSIEVIKDKNGSNINVKN